VAKYDWLKDNYYLKPHVRVRTIAAIVRSLPGVCEKRSILDVGCGAGILGQLLGESVDYYGCDGHRALFADQAASGCRITHWTYDETHPGLPFEEVRFDVIVCSGFLEYLTDRPRFLRLARSRIAEDGFLVASLINFFRLDRQVASCLATCGLRLRTAYHPLWRAPGSFSGLADAAEGAGWRVAGVFALPPWTSGHGPLRLPMIARRDMDGLNRFPIRLLLSQLVFVCAAHDVVWPDAPLDVP
jgi:SAM-dependent methyltransferase